MGDADLRAFVGEWELSVGLPGAEDARGRVVFEMFGPLLVQRSEVPDPAPNSICVVRPNPGGGYRQHYFDSRGVVRLYDMDFDGVAWTLTRSQPDFSPLDFHQRYVGRFSDDRATIEGEWQTSDGGRDWRLDFRLTYTCIS